MLAIQEVIVQGHMSLAGIGAAEEVFGSDRVQEELRMLRQLMEDADLREAAAGAAGAAREQRGEDGIPAWHPEDMADMGEGARELLGRRRCHHCGEYFWDDQSHYSRSAECEVANEALAGKGGPSPERESLSPSDSDEATNIEERKRQVQRWVSKMAGGRR